MISIVALMVANASAPAAPVELPIENASFSNLAFSCFGNSETNNTNDGYVVIGIDYDPTTREMDYNGSGDPMLFFKDPLKRVTTEQAGDERRWHIEAEGVAEAVDMNQAKSEVNAVLAGTKPKGSVERVPDKFLSRITLTIRQGPKIGTLADFELRRGDFVRSGTGCKLMPPRPKRNRL